MLILGRAFFYFDFTPIGLPILQYGNKIDSVVDKIYKNKKETK